MIPFMLLILPAFSAAAAIRRQPDDDSSAVTIPGTDKRSGSARCGAMAEWLNGQRMAFS
jgi:hypothetical protein